MQLKKLVLPLFVLSFVLFCVSCATTNAINDIDANPENKARGDISNPIKVKAFLEDVLLHPEGREIEAYTRKAFSIDQEKTIFVFHNFYVFTKDGSLEHTLVYTATPKESELNGTWMLDASSDIDSYNLFLNSDNPWDLQLHERPEGKDLSLFKTTQSILDRLEKDYRFSGTAGVRDMSWYHHLWLILVPPPVIAYSGALIASIGGDNCISAVNETVEWE